MSKKYQDSDEELDKDIDYDFFEDEKNNTSRSESHVSSKHKSNRSSRNSKLDNQLNGDKSDKESIVDDRDRSNTSSSSKLSSKSSRKSSSKSSLSSSLKSSKSSKSKSSSLSSKSASLLHQNLQDKSRDNSSSSRVSISIESLTNVSSASEEKEAEEIIPRSQKRNKMNVYNRNLKQVDHDLIPSEVILGAMLRIHEGRRVLRSMKPKWIDPNTKDYSVAGLTTKLNLLPQRLVNKEPVKRNMRPNPFAMQNKEPQKRLYHTALNRMKEQDRIEKENMAIFTRLQKIRPSPGITRAEMLREYARISRFNNSKLNSRARTASTSRCTSSISTRDHQVQLRSRPSSSTRPSTRVSFSHRPLRG